MCASFCTDMDVVIPALRGIADVPARESGDFFPGRSALALANSRSLRLRCYDMSWGYAKPGGGLIFNARSETAGEKPLFAEGVERHRCLVPATCYYEWQKRENGQKTKYALQPHGKDVFYLAGIYRMEGSTPVFTVLTGEPLSSIAFIHPRMPAMLPVGAEADWLNLDNSWREVLKDLAPREMEFRVCG